MKKYIALILVLCSLLSLAACGAAEPELSADLPETNVGTESDINTDVWGETESVEPPEELPEELPVNLSTVRITEANAFSDDYAWIRYINENDIEVYGLANISGEIVYTLPEGVEVSKLWSYQDGFAAYRVGEEYLSSYEVVIDATGKEYFHTESTDQRAERLLTWGDGIFVFSLREANMTGKTYSYIGKTADGEVKYTLLVDDLAYWENDWRYVGEGWYACEDSVYTISLSRGEQKRNYIGYIYGEFHDGEILYQMPYLGSRESYYRGDRDLNSITGSDYPGDFQLYVNRSEDYIGDGYYIQNSNYIDHYPVPIVRRWNGETVFELTKYTNITTELYPFCGDFAPYAINGKDGHEYLTAVDWQGNEVFEPRDLTANGEELAKKRLYEDHFLLQTGEDEYALMNLNQEYVHDVSADFPECEIEEFLSYTQGKLIIEFTSNTGTYFKYYSIEDAIAAGENVYDVGELFVEGSEEPSVDSSSDAPNKDYVYIGNLEIEGKWKSVGAYGFGQAQPGAIVIFDGNNCNFFSPSDTYALYEKDGEYYLDVTSFMSTDTLTFVVKATDEDHIDLHRGGNVTELERIS